MTILAPLPVQSFKDSNGNPLAGGLLYTYAAGTSTAQSTYIDSTGTTANTNPIVLNSRGEAQIWLPGGVAYKFILQDSSANLIWSVDQISNPAAASGSNSDITSLLQSTLTASITASAAGAADAITATFTPSITTLTAMMTVYVRATSANATTTPTFTPNSVSIPASSIVKGANLPLAPGDIAGAGHILCLQRDLINSNWVLQNPANGVVVAAVVKQIQTVSASVASSALTVTLNATSLDFRSPTLSAGTVNTRAIAASISVVVPSGATLGSVSGTQTRFVLLAIDATSLGGAVELSVVNIAGSINLDETTLITTTAISAAATASGVAYSTTARVSVPFRVVGYVDNTQTTAGAYATVPSTVQGFGGQALAAMSSLGYGQTWQNVAGSRVSGTTYYNTTGKPISVYVSTLNVAYSSAVTFSATVSGLVIASFITPNNANPVYGGGGITFVVPPGGSYAVQASAFDRWFELR